VTLEPRAVVADWNAAEAAYRKAIKLKPENGDIYNNLAWVRLKQERDLKEAEALIMKALSLTPDHRPYYLDTLGVILIKQARPREAVAALKESADSLPKDKPELLAETYTHLAEAYRAAGDTVHADEATAKARAMPQ
jgi:Tfp pilus assembly protein PilF